MNRCPYCSSIDLHTEENILGSIDIYCDCGAWTTDEPNTPWRNAGAPPPAEWD